MSMNLMPDEAVRQQLCAQLVEAVTDFVSASGCMSTQSYSCLVGLKNILLAPTAPDAPPASKVDALISMQKLNDFIKTAAGSWLAEDPIPDEQGTGVSTTPVISTVQNINELAPVDTTVPLPDPPGKGPKYLP